MGGWEAQYRLPLHTYSPPPILHLLVGGGGAGQARIKEKKTKKIINLDKYIN